MEFILKEKIRVGISACNAGAQVRWNRKGWDRLEPLQREKDSFIWTPVCPEVAAGLGVPRSTIRLTGGNGDDFWNGSAKIKNRQGRNVSAEMRAGMEESLAALKRAEVEAFFFMEGSPTCGVYRTTLKNKRLGKPPGAFGSLLLKENLFLVPSLDLQSPLKWWDWRRRLHAFAWLKRAEIESKKELYEIWHHFKFICQETNRAQADLIGNKLAQMPKRLSKQFIESWRSDVLLLLRQPSSVSRIQGFMRKHYAFYRKHVDTSLPEKPDQLRTGVGKQHFVDLVHELEKQSYKKGIHFGGTPVLYRGR